MPEMRHPSYLTALLPEPQPTTQSWNQPAVPECWCRTLSPLSSWRRTSGRQTACAGRRFSDSTAGNQSLNRPRTSKWPTDDRSLPGWPSWWRNGSERNHDKKWRNVKNKHGKFYSDYQVLPVLSPSEELPTSNPRCPGEIRRPVWSSLKS